MRIEELTSRIDIGTLSDTLGLSPDGARRRFCPVCQPGGGKSPDLSLTQNVDKGRWHCFKCGKHGDALDLVKLGRGCETPDAMRYLEAYVGGGPQITKPRVVTRPMRELTAEDREVVAVVLEDFLARCQTATGKATEAYWAKRGVPAQVLESVGIQHVHATRYKAIHELMLDQHGAEAMTLSGLAPISARTGKPYPLGWALAKLGVDACALPYIEGGQVVALKLRLLIDKRKAEDLNVRRFLATANEQRVFNGDALTPGETVLICEGESDTLTALSCGFAAVGIPGAVSFRREWVQRFDGINAVLAFDADDAGQRGVFHIVRLFREAGRPAPRSIALPKGQDLTDFIQAQPDPESWFSASGEALARAASRLCGQKPGLAIPADQIEQDAGLTLQGDERRAVWAEVAEFYATNADLRFEDGAVTWRQSEKSTEASSR